MKKQNRSFKKAFSLIELAIVIVVLGVLITGITKVRSLIALSDERAFEITDNPYKNPPRKGLVAWFSAQSGKNFNNGSITDGTAIDTWKNLAKSSIGDASMALTTGADANRPEYAKNGINGKPAVYFNADPNFLAFDLSSF